MLTHTARHFQVSELQKSKFKFKYTATHMIPKFNFMADQDQVIHRTDTKPDKGLIDHETLTQPRPGNMNQKEEVKNRNSSNVPQSRRS